MKSHIFYLLLALTLFCACKKEDCTEELSNTDNGGHGTTQSPPPSTSLIVGEWKLVSWYEDEPKDIDQDGNASTDLLSQWNGCRKNIHIHFKDDYWSETTYTGPDSPVNCPTYSNGDVIQRMEWSLRDRGQSEQALEFIGSDYIDSYEIETLDATTLILKGAGFITCCDTDISYYDDGHLKFERQ